MAEESNLVARLRDTTAWSDELAEQAAAEIERLRAALEYRHQGIERLRSALELFVKQWNACGPNSNFGRYFENVRAAAVKALAGSPVETESKPPREIWACVSKGISPPYVRFFESKAEMEAYEWRDDSVSPNRYRPAVETGACNHHFSELLASKDNAFEMRQCLECAKIFRVRLPEKATGDQE